MRHLSFQVTPYPYRVHFFTTRESWARFTAKKGFGKLHDRRMLALDADGVCSTGDDEAVCAVGVFNGSVSTLAHEMTHAAVRILTATGVRFSPNNHEALAYLVGYLVEKCVRSL